MQPGNPGSPGISDGRVRKKLGCTGSHIWNSWWNDREAAGVHQRPYLKFLVGYSQENPGLPGIAGGTQAGKPGSPGIAGGMESIWDAARKTGVTWNSWRDGRDAAGMHQESHLEFLVGCSQGNWDYLEFLVGCRQEICDHLKFLEEGQKQPGRCRPGCRSWQHIPGCVTRVLSPPAAPGCSRAARAGPSRWESPLLTHAIRVGEQQGWERIRCYI